MVYADKYQAAHPVFFPRLSAEAYRHVQQEPFVLAHHTTTASYDEKHRKAVHHDVDRRRYVKLKGERSEESVVEAEVHLFLADGRIKCLTSEGTFRALLMYFKPKESEKCSEYSGRAKNRRSRDVPLRTAFKRTGEYVTSRVVVTERKRLQEGTLHGSNTR